MGGLRACATPTVLTVSKGYTALHLASDRGHENVVQLLLAHGIDSSLKVLSPSLEQSGQC